MKIEIDLNEILGDEYGTETIEESVRRQVTDWLVTDFKTKMGNVLDGEIKEKVDSLIKDELEEKFPKMIEDLWEMEYNPVTRYGQTEREPTTLKNELLKTISEQLIYKKTGYSSDKTVFTKAVDRSVELGVSSFKKEFDETVTKELRKEAFKYALKQLSK